MLEIDLVAPEIEDLITRRRWVELREYLAEWPSPDIADLIMKLEKSERILVFRVIPRRVSSEVFTYLDPTNKDDLVKDLNTEETRQLLENLPPDDRTDFLEELPGQAIQRMLNLLSPEDLRETRQLLGFPEESVGREMTPDYVAVRPDWTIGQCLDHIRLKGRDSETINVVYVTDSFWSLLDGLELKKFILSKPTATVEEIMDFSVISISAYDDREKAVEMMQHYDLEVLPVVDKEGVLLGIVTSDDILDVAQEEATEDFHKGAAVKPLKTSYRETGVWSLYRKRILWLAALLGVNLASSGVIAAYEETLLSAISLAFFIPLLMASGGNTGAQSATLVVRAIATGDIELNQWLRTIARELAIGSLLGLTMGLIGWGLGWFKGGVEIALVVSLAMVSIVVVANFIGVVIPLLMTRMKIDPAIASSPLITSIVDVSCLLIYFSIATALLGM